MPNPFGEPGSWASNWMTWIVPSFLPVSLGFDLGGGWVQWVGCRSQTHSKVELLGIGTSYSWIGGEPYDVVASTSPMCDAINPGLGELKDQAERSYTMTVAGSGYRSFYDSLNTNDEALNVMGSENTQNPSISYIMIPGMAHVGRNRLWLC